MKVLVTGGMGFIGGHLIPLLLSRGHEPVVLDNLSVQIHGVLPDFDLPWIGDERVKLIRQDLLDWQALISATGDVDAVVHLAAETGTGQSMYKVASYNNINSQGTAILLQALLERTDHPIKKLVLASSRAVYGEGAYQCKACGPEAIQFPLTRTAAALLKGQWDPHCAHCSAPLSAVPTPEEAKLRPASIYAATKAAQEDLVRIFSESTNIPAVALRFQNVYGEGQSLNNPYTGILSIFSTRIRRRLSLPIFEDGKESRDFVHVADVVRAVVLALESDGEGYQVLNVGSGKPTSVMDLAILLAERLNSTELPVITGQYRIGDIRHCYADTAAAAKSLGFEPQIGLEEGLTRFIQWVLTQRLPEDQLGKAEQELRKFGLLRESC